MKKRLIEARMKDIPGLPGDFFDKTKKFSEEKYGITRGGEDLRRSMMLLQRILQIQDGHEEELTEIGKRLITQYYESILDGVYLDIKIVKPGDKEQRKMFTTGFQGYEKQKKKEKVEVDEDEVHKRKLMNNVMQGEGQNLHDMMYDAREELNEIDPQLLPLYDEFLKITLRLYWWDNPFLKQSISADMTNIVQVGWGDAEPNQEDAEENLKKLTNGSSIEDLKPIEYKPGKDEGDGDDEDGDEETSSGPWIKVRALILPLLLHETVKGIYELISAAAFLPDKKKETEVQSRTSSIDDELEDIKYGQYIATKLRDTINSIDDIDLYPNIREFIWGKMIILPAKEFINLMNGILNDEPAAKTKLEQLAKEVIRDLNNEEYVEPAKEVEKEEAKKVAAKDYPDFSSMDPKEVEKQLKWKTQGEINFLLNKAIDARDWKNVDIIGKYLKESYEGFSSSFNKIKKNNIKLVKEHINDVVSEKQFKYYNQSSFEDDTI